MADKNSAKFKKSLCFTDHAGPSTSSRATMKTTVRTAAGSSLSSKSKPVVIRHSKLMAEGMENQIKNVPSKKIVQKIEKAQNIKHNKFEEPQLNSALEITKQLQKLEIPTKSKGLTLTSSSDLTPRTRAVIVKGVTKKMNFLADEVIFKNLTPLNVNNTGLVFSDSKQLRKKYTPKAQTDPIPELVDFLKPIEPNDTRLPLYEKTVEKLSVKTKNFQKVYEMYKIAHPE